LKNMFLIKKPSQNGLDRVYSDGSTSSMSIYDARDIIGNFKLQLR